MCVCADCGEESGIGISWIQQKYIHVYVQYLPSHIFALLSIVVKFSLIHLILGQTCFHSHRLYIFLIIMTEDDYLVHPLRAWCRTHIQLPHGIIPYICTIDFHALSLISLHRLCLIDFVVLQLT